MVKVAEKRKHESEGTATSSFPPPPQIANPQNGVEGNLPPLLLHLSPQNTTRSNAPGAPPPLSFAQVTTMSSQVTPPPLINGSPSSTPGPSRVPHESQASRPHPGKRSRSATCLKYTQAAKRAKLKDFELPPAPSLPTSLSSLTPASLRNLMSSSSAGSSQALDVRLNSSVANTVQVTVVTTLVTTPSNGITISQFSQAQFQRLHHFEPSRFTSSEPLSSTQVLPRRSPSINQQVLAQLQQSTSQNPELSHVQGRHSHVIAPIRPPTNSLSLQRESLDNNLQGLRSFSALTSVPSPSKGHPQPAATGTQSLACLLPLSIPRSPSTSKKENTEAPKNRRGAGKGKAPAKNSKASEATKKRNEKNSVTNGKAQRKPRTPTPARKNGDTNGQASETGKKGYVPSYVTPGETCAVCGDECTGLHYRAMTCEGCKGFFRRTVQKKNHLLATFVCKHSGTCPITHSNRNSCPPCRFRHCLAAKMSIASVMKDKARLTLLTLISYNREVRQREANSRLSEDMRTFLQALGKAFKATASTNLYSFWSGREAQPNSSQNGPAVTHALHFVMTLRGMGEIDECDLMVLITHRLADFFVIHICVNWVSQTNELVFSDHRLGQDSALQSSEVVDYPQQGYDAVRAYYRRQYRQNMVDLSGPILSASASRGNGGDDAQGLSAAAENFERNNGKCADQGSARPEDVNEERRLAVQEASAPSNHQAGGSLNKGPGNTIDAAWQRFTAIRRRFPTTDQAWAELYDTDLAQYDRRSETPGSPDGVAIRKLYALVRKLAAFLREDGIILACLAGMRIFNTGGLEGLLKNASAIDSQADALADLLARYLRDPKLSSIKLSSALDCLRLVEEFLTYNRATIIRIARWYRPPTADEMALVQASVEDPNSPSRPASMSPSSENQDQGQGQAQDLDKKAAPAPAMSESSGSISLDRPSSPCDEPAAEVETPPLQIANDLSSTPVSTLPALESGTTRSSRVEDILKNPQSHLVLRGHSSALDTLTTKPAVGFRVDDLHESKAELYMVKSRGAPQFGETSAVNTLRPVMESQSPSQHLSRGINQIKIEHQSLKDLPLDRGQDILPVRSLVRSCLQSDLAPQLQAPRTNVVPESFKLAALRERATEAPPCSMTKKELNELHQSSRSLEYSNSYSLPADVQMAEEPLNLVVNRSTTEPTKSLTEQLRIAIQQRAKMDEAIRELVEKTGEEAARSVIDDQQQRVRSSSFGGSLSAPSLPTADTRAYSPQFRREFSMAPEGVWDESRQAREVHPNICSPRGSYSRAPPNPRFSRFQQPEVRVEHHSPVLGRQSAGFANALSPRAQQQRTPYVHAASYANATGQFHTERVLREQFHLPVSQSPRHGRHPEEATEIPSDIWSNRRSFIDQGIPQPPPRRSTVEELLKGNSIDRANFAQYPSAGSHEMNPSPVNDRYWPKFQDEPHDGVHRLFNGHHEATFQSSFKGQPMRLHDIAHEDSTGRFQAYSSSFGHPQQQDLAPLPCRDVYPEAHSSHVLLRDSSESSPGFSNSGHPQHMSEVYQTLAPRSSSTTSSKESSPSSTPHKADSVHQATSSLPNGRVSRKSLKKRWIDLHCREELDPTAPATITSPAATTPENNSQCPEGSPTSAQGRRQAKGHKSK